MERIRRLVRGGKSKADQDVELRERMKNHEYRATEHQATLEELAAELGTSLNYDEPKDSAGLPNVVAASRLIEEGRNILSPPKKTPEWVKFLLHFTDFFMLLLLVAATLSCIVYGLDTTQLSSLVVGIFLYVVVLIDVTISYVQERASSNVMQTFSKMLPQSCKVIRDGFEREVGADELVRGDIVKFQIGDKIPADMRIIFNQQAKVECSSITGESTPISLTAEKTHERPTETRNLVFNGSLCLNGEAYGVVIRTGDHTLIGQIASLAGAQSSKPTTLQLEIQYFVKFIAFISTCTAIIFFIVGMARGQSFLSTFVNGFIVVILAFLPCGLPTAVTSIISICAKKMAKKNVYVKKLDIVETLGSTSLIASDKTGTLTQNVMTVVSFWFNSEFINVNNTNGTNSMLLVDLMEDPSFKLILQCSSLCNRARFSDEGSSAPASTVTTEHDPSEHHEDQKITINQLPRRASFAPSIAPSVTPSEYPETIKERTVLGDASDAAIFRFVNQLGIAERLRRQYPKVFEIPFNSTIKHSIAIVNDPIADETGVRRHHLMFIKGAPEIILSKCGRYYHKGQIKDVNEEFTTSVTTAMKRSGAAGERVLAFAMASIDNPPEAYTEDPPNYPTEGIVFLGLVSLVDPPRPNVPEAIKQLKKAHIKVLMVTGDHPITAEAIARKVNIIGDGKTRVEVAKSKGLNLEDIALSDKEVQAVVVSGSELNTFTEEQWRVVLSKKEIVFARTTPTQKLEIVERNQALGYVVAVTGDGVNDSPALKAADVGVAMGKMGSDVAREAADIVLITDDFASILDAVKMGRLIFDNLKKTIAYTLPHVIPELVPVLCTLTFSFPLALNSILILCIDLGTEMFPSVSLAYEKAESNIMTRPPRNTKKDKMASYQILNYSYILAGIPETAACFFAFLFVFIQHGIPLSYLPNTSSTYWQSTSPDFIVGDLTFTADEQVNILNEAGTTYFLTLVLCQFWHIWFARTSRASTFRRRPRNLVMIMGCIISLCLTAIIVYVPGLQGVLGSADVIGINYTMNLTFLVYIGIFTETIKYFARTYKKGFAAKHLVY